MHEDRSTGIGAILSDGWHGLREGWRDRAGRRTAWAATLGGGLIVSLAATWGLVAATRAAHGAGALDWEQPFLRDFTARSFPSLFDAITLDAFGATVILLPLILVVAVPLLRQRRVLTAFTLLAGYVGAKIVTHAGWMIWERARPEIVLDGRLNPGASAFPSGHTVQVVVVYGLLAWLWTRRSPHPRDTLAAGAVLLAVLLATAASRLRVGAHWPTDVLAGLVLGALWAAAAALAIRRGGEA